jgi:hypothetical protein
MELGSIVEGTVRIDILSQQTDAVRNDSRGWGQIRSIKRHFLFSKRKLTTNKLPVGFIGSGTFSCRSHCLGRSGCQNGASSQLAEEGTP